MTTKISSKKSFWKNVIKYRALLLMVLPGFVWFIFFFYIPVLANVVAFKDFHYSAGGFLQSLKESPWVGLDNFKYLFASKDAWLITRNTIAYNLIFLLFNVFFAIAFAIIMSELRNKKAVKVYHTMSLLPYFLSWVVIEYFVSAFLNTDKGFINQLLIDSGNSPIKWYSNPTWWPLILLFMSVWKGLGYNSIIYYASVKGISDTYYEAAMVDGASKWQQIRHITIPQLLPMMSILLIINIGSIFKSDFGLFYVIPKNSGPLYDVTSVLDTYVYNALTATGDISMASAASLYQSVVGTCILLITNAFVRRMDPDAALF
ncbi:TPA: sugar ABC transporter permease [Streptococcus equi subsp. zooepidemicus]|uniref:ABC transporter permease n=1 Tax=Streptococcus equi TaxID=1336 RepID=UPI0005B780B4|nr:sugar ABC transporter permease [Streptococcus equi]VTP93420.1 sugar transport system permease [Streptococcus equi subsp. zooepidemicus]KIS16558.1 sugar transport system permease [Streptococcus equi subsp. zooepidemicus SzAM35]HEK9996138.1 sugar ABC transporter permease [Streptococcus equi subsp. zooepidemicus]HEL0553469.1 sugar ABC transporter permease [Streptococcus equi subsp. zooepidemicus]HEL0583280.1 sugar ABC transporter permease [Streptococcus equi subsp. zooepidemicus]